MANRSRRDTLSYRHECFSMGYNEQGAIQAITWLHVMKKQRHPTGVWLLTVSTHSPLAIN